MRCSSGVVAQASSAASAVPCGGSFNATTQVHATRRDKELGLLAFKSQDPSQQLVPGTKTPAGKPISSSTAAQMGDKEVSTVQLMQQRANGHIAQLTAQLEQERAARSSLEAVLADRERCLKLLTQRCGQAGQAGCHNATAGTAPVAVTPALRKEEQNTLEHSTNCTSNNNSSPCCGSPVSNGSPCTSAPTSRRASTDALDAGAPAPGLDAVTMAATIAELQHKLAASENAAAAAAAEQSQLQAQKALKETKTDVQVLQFDLAEAQQQSAGLSVQLAQARAAADAACQLQAVQAADLTAAGCKLVEAQQAAAGLRAAAEADAVRLAEQAGELAACRKTLAACQAQRDRAEQLAQQAERRAERAEGEAVTLSLDLQQERNGHMRARAQKADMEGLYLKAKARRHERKALLLWLLDCGDEEAGKAADHVPLVGRLQQKVERQAAQHAAALRTRELANAALHARLDFAEGELQRLRVAAAGSSDGIAEGGRMQKAAAGHVS